MRPKTLRVGLPGRRVGTLEQGRSGLVTWAPDAAWEAAGQIPRLGVDFLREPGAKRAATGLPPWFENLLPEAESTLRARLAAIHGVRETQSFALLAAAGADLAGAVEIGVATTSDSEPPSESALGAGQDTEERPLATPGDEALRISSLAGMQLKFSMSMVNERLALPARGRTGQWIVKFPGERYPQIAEVEAATMTWAREAGFDVPAHRVVGIDRLEGLPAAWTTGVARVFAIRRFDRRDDGSRIHQEDLCQALRLPPLDKYGDREPRVSFAGAIRLVADVCGDGEGREMARRMGFSIVAGNSDAHLKNWSLLWGASTRPKLTPCYDLVATISWPDQLGWGARGGPAIALSIGGAGRFGHLTGDALARCQDQASLPWLASEVREGIRRARDAWSRVAPHAPARMRDALAVHAEEVPLLRGA